MNLKVVSIIVPLIHPYSPKNKVSHHLLSAQKIINATQLLHILVKPVKHLKGHLYHRPKNTHEGLLSS